MNKKTIIRINESQLKNCIKKIIKEEVDTIKKETSLKEEVGEKTKNTIDKWRSEMGDRKTAIKLIDYMLERMVGMSSGDLADTSTFANGIDGIEGALVDGDYKGALNIAGDTAKDMIDDEGFGDMFEGVNVSKTNKKDSEGRPIYKSEDGEKYVDVSLGKSKKPELHSVTKEGEPNTPLKNFVIKENESWMKMRAGAKGKVFENDEEFMPDGTYTVSNSGGYEIMLSDSGDMAKVKDAFGSDTPKISDWLEIEYVPSEDGEMDDEGYPEMVPVIDPNGYNIPLNMVMRIDNQKDDMGDMDDMVSKYDDQESGKYTQNMDDVESGILPEEENQKLNETVNRFKQIINY